MNLDDLARTLAAIKQARDQRIEIWVRIIEADGTEAERIYCGSFQRHPINAPSGE